MAKKYDIDDIDKKIDDKLKSEDIRSKEKFIDNLAGIKELDEQNPLEQAIKYRAVKQNPPEPGYMGVKCYKVKDAKGKDIVVSESEITDPDGKKSIQRFKHDPFFTIDLNTAIAADITACPSSTIPMLLDMAQKKVELKKTAFKVKTRREEFNWWWILFAILLIPGIATAILWLL